MVGMFLQLAPLSDRKYYWNVADFLARVTSFLRSSKGHLRRGTWVKNVLLQSLHTQQEGLATTADEQPAQCMSRHDSKDDVGNDIASSDMRGRGSDGRDRLTSATSQT